MKEKLLKVICNTCKNEVIVAEGVKEIKGWITLMFINKYDHDRDYCSKRCAMKAIPDLVIPDAEEMEKQMLEEQRKAQEAMYEKQIQNAIPDEITVPADKVNVKVEEGKIIEFPKKSEQGL